MIAQEEMKWFMEHKKILHDVTIQVVPTSVRVPGVSFPLLNLSW